MRTNRRPSGDHRRHRICPSRASDTDWHGPFPGKPGVLDRDPGGGKSGPTGDSGSQGRTERSVDAEHALQTNESRGTADARPLLRAIGSCRRRRAERVSGAAPPRPERASLVAEVGRSQLPRSDSATRSGSAGRAGYSGFRATEAAAIRRSAPRMRGRAVPRFCRAVRGWLRRFRGRFSALQRSRRAPGH